MSDGEIRVASYASEGERSAREDLHALLEACPIPREEMLANLGVFLTRQSLSRTLFMADLYRRIIEVHGIVIELGVRWGRDLALFQALRGIYEPYNYTRRIVGFDSFDGFPSVDAKDGSAEIASSGAYRVTDGYDAYLGDVLDQHERESPLAHIRKHELIKGDATQTLPAYLEEHPETIVAFAYFDFDIYEPTKRCLEAIRPHLTRGSVLGFDELCHPDFPGETLALKEVLGLDSHRLRRSPIGSYPSFLVIE